MSAPVRVLHLLGTAQPGGVESYVRDLGCQIDRRRFELSVCVLGPDGPMAREIAESGIGVSLIGSPDLRNARSLARYVSVLAKSRPQIVHANTGGRAHVTIARMAGCRRLITHFHAFPETWMDQLGSDETRIRAELRRTVQKSDVVLACSNWLSSQIRRLLGSRAGDVRHVPNGVSLERWSADAIDREAVNTERKALGIPAGAPVVGFVGRFVRQKGLPHVLAAAQLLKSRMPSAVFVLAGSGPLEDSTRKAAADGALTNVRFAGGRVDPRALMSLFDVTIMPSEWEPFGIVALESLALRKPVVCFAVGGLPEIVVDNETGLAVAPGDDAALAEAVVSLLASPELRRKLGDNGRDRVAERFDLRSSVRSVENVYDSLF